MKQTVNIDDYECPRESVNRSRTTPSDHTDALHRNLIVVPHAGFTTATVQRFHSPFSSSTLRSRAGKLEATQHHRNITRREEEKNQEKNFLVYFILKIPSAFYKRDSWQEPLILLNNPLMSINQPV
jgi:hypothetical protein